MEEDKPIAGSEEEEEDLSVKCPHCGKKYKNRDSLRAHKSDKHSGKILQCPTCLEVMGSRRTLLQHMKSHEEKVECPECQRGYATERSLSEHLKNIHGRTGETIPCPSCTKVFWSEGALRAHNNLIHKTGGEFTCSLCDHNYVNQSVLDKHMVKEHAGQDNQDIVLSTSATEEKHNILSQELEEMPKEGFMSNESNRRKIIKSIAPSGTDAVAVFLQTEWKKDTPSITRPYISTRAFATSEGQSFDKLVSTQSLYRGKYTTTSSKKSEKSTSFYFIGDDAEELATKAKTTIQVTHVLANYLLGKENALVLDFPDIFVSLRGWDKSLVDACLLANNLRVLVESREDYARRSGTGDFNLCPITPELFSKTVTGHGHIYMLFMVVDGVIQLYVGLNANPGSGLQIGAKCHGTKLWDATAWGEFLKKLEADGVNLEEREFFEDIIFYCGTRTANDLVLKKMVESAAIMAAAFNNGGQMTHEGKQYPFKLLNNNVSVPNLTNELWSIVTCVSKKLFDTRFVINQIPGSTVTIPIQTQCVSDALQAIHFE